MSPVLRLSTFVLFAGSALGAQATLIDFEEFPGGSGSVSLGPFVSSQGYQFAATAADAGYTTEFFKLANDFSPFANYTGSVALYAVDSTIELTREDGTAFSLNSLDVTTTVPQSSGLSRPPTIEFVGHRADGSAVTQSFSVAQSDALQTVTFSGFTDLVSVTWDDKYSPTELHQFDNVNVQAVPEPASMAALGLGALGLLRRRKVV